MKQSDIELAIEAGFIVNSVNKLIHCGYYMDEELAKYTELIRANGQVQSEPVAYADYERGTCHLIGTPIPKYEIKNPLYTSPPDLQAKLDKARDDIALAYKILDEGMGNHPKICAMQVLSETLKEIS